MISDPAVISQGYDPAVVDEGLKAQLQALVAAGYNTKEVWFGPEEVGNVMVPRLISKASILTIGLGFGLDYSGHRPSSRVTRRAKVGWHNYRLWYQRRPGSRSDSTPRR